MVTASRVLLVTLAMLVASPAFGQEDPFAEAVTKLEKCGKRLDKCKAFDMVSKFSRSDPKRLESLAGGTLTAQRATLRIMSSQGMDTKALFVLMESKDNTVLLETLGLIANTRHTELAPAVLEMARKAYKSGNEQLLLKTVFALGRLQYADAAPLLLDLLESDVQKIGRAATEALGRVGGGEEIVAKVVKQAKDTESPLNRRLAAIRGLGHFKNAAATDALVEFSRDDDVQLRKAAIVAMGIGMDRRAVPQLFERMKDPEVTNELIDALARIGGEKAASMLSAMSRDEDRSDSVRDAALFAAGRAGSQRVMPELLKALESRKSDRRIRAAEAIGFLGDAGAVEPLYAVFKKAKGKEKTMVHWAIKRCSNEALDTPEQIEAYLKSKSSK